MSKIVVLLKNNIYPLSLYARQIAGTVVLFVIARYLSVYDYGLFSSYKALAAFCLLFANIGYNEYILVSSQNVVKKVRLKIGLFVINAIFVMLLIACGSIFTNLESNLLFLLVLFRTFLDATFFSIMLPYFQAANKFNIVSYVNIFYSTVMIIIALVSYIFHLSLIKFLILNICLGVFNFIQLSIYAKINYAIVFTQLKRMLLMLDKSIFAYIGTVICSYLYTQIPSLYSSLFITKQEAALYFAAYLIAGIIGLIITAQVQKMVPEMIKASVQKINKVINREMFLIMSINTLVFVFFLIFGEVLLQFIYGQNYYQNAYPILLILCFANISIALASIYGAYITASGNQRLKIRMQIEAILIAIVSLAIFHKLGIYGAAISYFLSATHIGIRYVLKTKQLLKNAEVLA